MAAHWWWSWSIGLNSTAYSNSGFTVSSTAFISTNNTSSLFTPAPGSISPSEEFHLRVSNNNSITTPTFQNGSVTQGWLIFRYLSEGFGPTGTSLISLKNGATNVVELRHTELDTSLFQLSIFVNNALVGTSSVLAVLNANYIIAIDFDLVASQPEAGLVVNGKRQVVRGNSGTGSATSANNLQIFSGSTSSSASIYGDIAVFNSLSDLTDRSSQDVWITFLDPDQATDADNSWTPSAGTDITAVNDASATTFTETSTSPDSITYGFESCNTRRTGWSPTLVYGLATVAYASAATSQTNTTLDLQDLVPATVSSTNVTLTSTNTFLGVWTSQDSTTNPWTTAKIDGSTAIYSVA